MSQPSENQCSSSASRPLADMPLEVFEISFVISHAGFMFPTHSRYELVRSDSDQRDNQDQRQQEDRKREKPADDWVTRGHDCTRFANHRAAARMNMRCASMDWPRKVFGIPTTRGAG